jgi:hypothetical protein
MLSANVAAPNFKYRPPSPFQSTTMGCKVLTGMISCDPDSLWHLGMRFKQYYITHRLAQLDIGITNAVILYFEAHPELKNKECQHRKFNESIANHFIQVRSISWEALYGNSILNIYSQTPGN